MSGLIKRTKKLREPKDDNDLLQNASFPCSTQYVKYDRFWSGATMEEFWRYIPTLVWCTPRQVKGEVMTGAISYFVDG